MDSTQLINNTNQIIIDKNIRENEGKMNREGNKIYKENDYLSKIWDIMSNKEFTDFFDSYLTHYNDVQVAMVFFNVYKMIKTTYKQRFNKDIRRGVMMYLLREFMRNKEMMRYCIENTQSKNMIQIDDYLKTNVNSIMDNNTNILMDK